ncbi:hypothetical protein BLNAU_6215 [Blattamonas nauphoetae]|uniref:Uncharacterized protein n=1 Tax=Blattamonas nauphoetae TaxID=2049346 RepID=A0ABQ9Y4N8_9EUKA|nr:hypothetical protein BLNAU_6215 [Blattamonas nauphoetae]
MPALLIHFSSSSYSIITPEETIYFNYFGIVNTSIHCALDTNDTTAYSVSGEDESFCWALATNGTEILSLIRRNPRLAPVGLRAVYPPSKSASAGNFTIDLMCSRLQYMNVTRSTTFDYRVVWNHPYGCPRSPRNKTFVRH